MLNSCVKSGGQTKKLTVIKNYYCGELDTYRPRHERHDGMKVRHCISNKKFTFVIKKRVLVIRRPRQESSRNFCMSVIDSFVEHRREPASNKDMFFFFLYSKRRVS